MLIWTTGINAKEFTFNLPELSTTERQKIILNNGWIVHNELRERQINDKLDEYAIRLDSCNKAVNTAQNGRFWDNFKANLGSFSIGLGIGTILGAIIISKID